MTQVAQHKGSHFLGISKKDSAPIITVILMSLLIVVAYFYGKYQEKQKYRDFLSSFRSIREGSDKYSFINPLIGAVSAPATDVGVFVDLKKEVLDFLNKEESLGNLYDYSLYFRDQSSGLWFGINDQANFFPASLFKLPIAIATYKQGEEDPSFFKKTAYYSEDLDKLNDASGVNSESKLSKTRPYSVEELVYIMLIDSDNGAKDLLLSMMDKKYLNQFFQIMSMVDPETVRTYEVSSRKYALFLRSLYNSSYLSEEHSEYLLSLLAKSTFHEGLADGVPANIPVAHKYGVYELEEDTDNGKRSVRLLHDCGIVYHSEKPYVFCFMTKGKDVPTLEHVIKSVSKIIYDYQDKSEE